MAERVVTILLAGGRGTRLDPLTRDRAKPAVPFGGVYRIVDFALSNCLNSQLNQILVLTQYKSLSLDRHIQLGWTKFFHCEFGHGLDVVPPQQRVNEDWYLGTADAVYQNIYSIERADADDVLILAGDHVYKMDYRRLLRFHRHHGGPATVATLPVHVDEAAGQFGVIEVDANRRIIGFEEKPSHPKPLPENPERCLASMGIYVFCAYDLLSELSRRKGSSQPPIDFGHDILPELIQRQPVYAFCDTGQTMYWRDVGTLDAFHEASLDLLKDHPALDLFDSTWPIYSWQPPLPPPRVSGGRVNETGRSHSGSLISSGSRVDGDVSNSVIGLRCSIERDATIDDSVLFDRVKVGPGARIRRAILDKDVVVEAGADIGLDRRHDEVRGFTLSPGGITCVPRDALVIA